MTSAILYNLLDKQRFDLMTSRTGTGHFVPEPLLITFFEDRDQIVQLLALDAEEIVHDEGATFLVPANIQIRALCPGIQQVNDL